MDILNNLKVDKVFYKDLFRLLEINTIKDKGTINAPFGCGIKAGLDTVLKISEEYGFKSVNLDNFIGYAEYKNSDSDEYVGVLGHIDVVPVGEGWDTDPFKPVIKDGKLYARGSVDDKGPLFAALYALKYLKDSNIKLSKNVRVIFGTNEESGTEDIDYYLKKEKPPTMCFTPDAYFPIVTSEKGILTFVVKSKILTNDEYKINYIKGGKKSNIVPDICEAVFSYKDRNFLSYFSDVNLREEYNIELIEKEDSLVVKAYGKSAHASTPEEGDNAGSKLLSYLNKVLSFKDTFTNFLRDFNKFIGRDYNGEKLGINYEDEESGKLTINLGIINSSDNEITMRFNVRYPVTIDHLKIINKVKDTLRESSLEFVMGNHNYPLHFPKDHNLIKSLKKAYEETFNKEAELLASGGGTYAKLMPNTVAFGPLNVGEEDLAHQKNEYIEVAKLEDCVRAYVRAIYELAK